MSRTLLLATDHKQSVITEVGDAKPNSIRYCAYGQPSATQAIVARLAFNGAFRERSSGWYFLGNGYRIYNPVLRCFHSPDSWSPFGEGGFNAYRYCGGDPVNNSDPSGHMRRFFSRRRSPSPPPENLVKTPAKPNRYTGDPKKEPAQPPHSPASTQPGPITHLTLNQLARPFAVPDALRGRQPWESTAQTANAPRTALAQPEIPPLLDNRPWIGRRSPVDGNWYLVPPPPLAEAAPTSANVRDPNQKS